MPARELADGIVVLVGGTLLLAPGFLTDIVGFALVLPFTRPVARRLLEAVISRRLIAQSPYFGRGLRLRRSAAAGRSRARTHPVVRPPSGDVIEGEIIDE